MREEVGEEERGWGEREGEREEVVRRRGEEILCKKREMGKRKTEEAAAQVIVCG